MNWYAEIAVSHIAEMGKIVRRRSPKAYSKDGKIVNIEASRPHGDISTRQEGQCVQFVNRDVET